MDLQQRSMISSEEIYEDLCRKIEKLEYMPGTSISESEICAEYHTSRHIVRGAFAMLRQRQLLEVYPQRGSYVSLIDMDYISNIMYIRESVEQQAAQIILDNGSMVEIVCQKMRENLDRQKIWLKEKTDRDDFYHLDEQFHDYLLEYAGHGNAMKILEDHYIHFRRWRNLDLNLLLREEAVVKQHEAVVRDLEKRDREAIRKSLHAHIDSMEVFHETLEKTNNEYFYKRPER